VYGRFRAKRTIQDLPVPAQRFSQLDRTGSVLVTPERTGNLAWYDTFFHCCLHGKPQETSRSCGILAFPFGSLLDALRRDEVTNQRCAAKLDCAFLR
jgi:hypothetical protein